MNSFERGGNPIEQMGLGGLSFDTLKPGAILIAKRYFGVSISTGRIGGFHSSAIRVSKNNYFLITEIREGFNPGTKNIRWSKFHKFDWVKEEKELFGNGGKAGLSVYGYKGFFHDLTKRRFDYRLEVIEIGFHES